MAHGDMKGFAKAQARYENQEDPAYSQEDVPTEECEECEGVGTITEDEETEICSSCEGNGFIEIEEEEDFDPDDYEPDYDDAEADYEFDYEYDPH